MAHFDQRPRQFSHPYLPQSQQALHQHLQQQEQSQIQHQHQQQQAQRLMEMTAAVPTMAIGAIPLFSRSISAPHMHFSGHGQDVFIPYGAQQGLPPLGQNPLTTATSVPPTSSAQSLRGNNGPSPFGSGILPSNSMVGNLSCGAGPNFVYQQPVHPMDQLTTSFDDLDVALPQKQKLEFPTDPFLQQVPSNAAAGLGASETFSQQQMDKALPAPASSSPTSSTSSDSSTDTTFTPSYENPSTAPFRPALRGQSISFFEAGLSTFDTENDFPDYAWSRHGSTGSLFPLSHSDDFQDYLASSSIEGNPPESVAMLQSSSSTSIMSTTSTSSSSSSSSSQPIHKASKVKARRASVCTDAQGPVYQCQFNDCHRPFRRQEHLKRHIRSVHTLEKPFGCPIDSCTRRFSRSDNLNQHIRIHRHDVSDQGLAPQAPPITFAYHQPHLRQ
ncbi:hypothetical protein EMPS_10104 [Entomortierella parvispora]|uniref:C2H2-type domain-containing protein n=1 Tax=Entomortierella parvispora TaxID=205924 RepID=A0A9P3HJA3_9FUNG|nr:hypothetical protein EMPS_10104 [Entomortierella parvispora]